MARQSLENFLKSMSAKPQTFGWDAVIAYDRNTTNHVLMQEYIDRFEGTAYFETLTFAVPITQGWQVSEGQRLDKPRLKFEDANLGNSSADLSMRIVGGRQFHVGTDLDGAYRFNSIKLADALNGPVLHVRLELGKTPGAVEPVENGQADVVIDLSNPSWKFYLTFSDFPEENELGGARYKELFSKWDDDKKKLTLNTLSIDPEGFVQPAGFLIRTHAEPNASNGEGAVLLFVKMQGSENGNMPADDKDFLYLLPDAQPPYTTNVVFSQKYFLRRLVANWFAKLNSANADKPFRFKVLGRDADGAYSDGIEATQGVFQVPSYRTPPDFYPYLDFQNGFNFPFADDPIYGSGTFTVRRDDQNDGDLDVFWEGVNNCYLVARPSVGTGIKSGESDFSWEGSALFTLEIDDQKRCYLHPKSSTVTGSLALRAKWYEYITQDPEWASVITHGNRIGGEQVRLRLNEVINNFTDAADNINLFMIHGLLFRGGAELVEPDKAYIPGDVVLPGYLAPSRTTLKLNATEVTIGAAAGSFYQFRAEPASGVTWTVSNLPDEEGDYGSIDGNGKYTPPAASTIPNAQKTVLVTATSGGNTSRALVTIIKRSIALDPVIMTAEQISAKDNEYKVSGASLQGSVLQWSMSQGAIGSIKPDPNPLPDVQDGRLYVVPKKSGNVAPMAFNERYGKPMPLASEQWQARRAAGGKLSDEDLAEVLATEQIIVTGAGDPQTIDVLLPLENETHWFKYKPMADGGAVQLELWGRDKSGDFQVPAEDTEWFLVMGNGTLVDGLYTAAATDSYAVVAAIEIDNRNYYWTYAILPMPYLDVAPIIADEARS
ncbi:hypothetical protein [Pseudomonas putida]|uniref:hypothetical protein n=1 Tax=Pseudomonas putida TaxID=303 RepID=UPI0020C5703A|nr:hypothetical protein [Pseudomonas putida]UTL82541.1 hypothetical protein NL778_06975 [Pseudomonas putida]